MLLKGTARSVPRAGSSHANLYFPRRRKDRCRSFARSHGVVRLGRRLPAGPHGVGDIEGLESLANHVFHQALDLAMLIGARRIVPAEPFVSIPGEARLR